MARAPLVLLLAAAATAAGGVWEEVGRNTDVTAWASVASDLVERGRAPDVGPLAAAYAEARLSIPASTLNLVLTAGADRSLDGAPRLDRRFAGITAEYHGYSELCVARLSLLHELNLGVNPASLGRLRSETGFEVALDNITLWGLWDLGFEVAVVPRREEHRVEASLEQLFAIGESGVALHLGLHVGDLRALDADGDGQGRVEGWSYAAIQASLVLDVGPADTFYLTFGTQQATDSRGVRDGWVELTYRRMF